MIAFSHTLISSYEEELLEKDADEQVVMEKVCHASQFLPASNFCRRSKTMPSSLVVPVISAGQTSSRRWIDLRSS
jgi:hypothetical protein